jgi:predicted 2-oxoglutarate/Fe(II)-dependent dioxygenase YbiX
VTYFLDPNLKWLDVVTNNNAYDHLQSLINRTVPVSQYCQRITYHPPVIVIPDVLNKALIYRLIDAWEAGKQSDEGAAGDKSRTDPQARHGIDAQILNPELQAALDQAFAKNLLPELHKLTGYNLRYRERHQISCYKAGDSGEFANRRATDQVPLSFRRYAVNIILNEGFAGGEQVFPEYGNYAYTTGPGSALVFPAPLMYEMKPVSAGKRFVLSTFLFDEEQAAYRSCYRQFNDEPDDTPDYRITVGNSFDELPARSIYTRSLKESVVDSDGFYPKTLEYPPKSSEEPHLVDTPPGIMMIENYLPAQLCQRWREHAEGKLGSVLQVVDFDKSSADKTVSRLSTGRVTERVPLDDIMDDVTKEFVRIYSSTLAGFYHVEFEWFEEPQMLRYTEGGLYNCHADADNWLKSEQRWVRSHDRDYSVLLYINSDFAGGELYFPRLDYRFKPRQGMLVAFPSSYRYEHAAEKTTAGLRYALVSWAAILGSQRVKEKAPYASVFLNEVDIK